MFSGWFYAPKALRNESIWPLEIDSPLKEVGGRTTGCGLGGVLCCGGSAGACGGANPCCLPCWKNCWGTNLGSNVLGCPVGPNCCLWAAPAGLNAKFGLKVGRGGVFSLDC